MDIKELVAELAAVRGEYREVTKRKNELEGRKKELEGFLLDDLSALGMESIKVGGTTYGQRVKEKPIVVDWDAYYQYIESAHAFHLLHKSATATAITELLENGVEVPGVEVRQYAEIYYR